MLLFKLIAKILGAIFLATVLYFGFTAYQVWRTSQQYLPHQSDAIVVMGTAEYNGVPSPVLKSRLDEALSLYKAGLARQVVVTGGNRPGDTYTEAQVSASYLEARGVPANVIIEAGGNDSYLNIADAAPAMHQSGIKTVMVVTDPFHEMRSMAIVSTFGFTPYPTPTKTSPISGYHTIPYFAKETLAVGVGRIIGYGMLSQMTTNWG